MEQTYSDTSAGDKIEIYEFLEALGLLDNEVSPVNMDDDDNNEFDIDDEDSDDDQDNYWKKHSALVEIVRYGLPGSDGMEWELLPKDIEIFFRVAPSLASAQGGRDEMYEYNQAAR